MAAVSSAEALAPRMVDGFPDVPRFSSLYNYLELCEVGSSLVADNTLQDTIEKVPSGKWQLLDGARELTALEIVEEIRFVIGEEDDGRDVDRVFIFMEPVDRMKIKREVAEQEPEERELQRGMKLAEIDLTGDDAIETATFDGGSVPQQVCNASAATCVVCTTKPAVT